MSVDARHLHRYASGMTSDSSKQRGIAIIMVLFVVTLASIIVLSLTYTTFLSSRANEITQKSLRAEYLLKSAINLARVLLQEDKTPEDSTDDLWGKFSSGQAVPLQLLGIEEPNVAIELEIRPEEAKLPLRALLNATGDKADERFRGIFSRLFKKLGFDDDHEKDQTGIYKDRVFTGDEMIANLVDYMDANSESYGEPGFASGIEGDGQIPKDYFPNTKINRTGELSLIPGFTPNRLRKLMPLVTVFGNNQVNINLAPKLVIESLHEEIDDSQADSIIAFRNSEAGPFDNFNRNEELTKILGEAIYRSVSPYLAVNSRWFQVLAKVDYGQTSYFMRSYLTKGARGELPVIRSVELF